MIKKILVTSVIFNVLLILHIVALSERITNFEYEQSELENYLDFEAQSDTLSFYGVE